VQRVARGEIFTLKIINFFFLNPNKDILVVQKNPCKEVLRSKLLGVRKRTFKRLKSFFRAKEKWQKDEEGVEMCCKQWMTELIRHYRLTPGPNVLLRMALCSSTN